MIKKIIHSILSLLLFLAVLFIPAGRLDWWDAWIFLGVFLIFSTCLGLWLKKHDPELLKERRQRTKDARKWDKVIIKLYNLFLLILLVIAGLDAGRFGWAPVPLFLRVGGGVLLILGMMIVIRTFSENTFLGAVVRIQKDRGHKVITTGPYRFVRHPMYVGVILSVVSIPLLLNSLWALIPAGCVVVVFIVRAALEDRTLHEELVGYPQYCKRIRFKLLPYVW